MARRRHRTAPLGVLLVTVGLFAAWWLLRPRQVGDPDFSPTIARAGEPSGIRVLIDAGHVNVHQVDGRYAPFALLARAAGFRVEGTDGWVREGVLEPSTILVIANAMGVGGAADQIAAIVGLDRIFDLTGSAFSEDEITTLERWVSGGGSLLLIADHRPAGGAAAQLARAFSVEMTNGYVEDPEHRDAATQSPTFIVFDRVTGLGNHPVLEGHSSSERVNRVVTFTGQALRAGGKATPLLRLSPTAIERAGRRPDAPVRSVAGLAQAVAVEHGSGRVVVLGEAAVATSQLVGPPDDPLRMGLQWPGSDNEQFMANVLAWLARTL